MHYAEFAEDEVKSHMACVCTICRIAPTDFDCLQSQALLNAIKEYENNKWKVIGQKVGKPAKVNQLFVVSSCQGVTTDKMLIRMQQACEQYAKEHFPGTFVAANERCTSRSGEGGGGLILSQISF